MEILCSATPRVIAVAAAATLVAIATVPCPLGAESPATEERLDAAPASNDQVGYLQYLPEGYADDPDKRWPLVVFLHGAGERGDDLDLVKVHGPPKLVEAGRKFPFIVIAPQCPADSWWSWEPVMPLIEHIESKLRVDPERIYLTGLSMGGYGTWTMASRHPAKFAAIAPICGGGVPYLARRLAKLPVWAFHGARDSVVPLSESQRLVDVLEKQGNKHVKFTVYPEANHDSWTPSYANDALYEWLLSHRRDKPATVPAKGAATPAAAQ